jgi:hypothetical protein
VYLGFESLLGFTQQELTKALQPAGGGLTDENEIPKVEELAVSRPDDIWRLGQHRIACGDCTDAGVMEALLELAKLLLMVTDPPVGEFSLLYRIVIA